MAVSYRTIRKVISFLSVMLGLVIILFPFVSFDSGEFFFRNALELRPNVVFYIAGLMVMALGLRGLRL